MAFVGIRVPHETARLLSEIDVPGKKDSTAHFHVTVIHLGDNVPIETLAKTMVATFGVTSKLRPFTVSTSRVTCFPAKDKPDAKVPIICRVDSDALHDLWKNLCSAYDSAGIEYSKRFPEFKPHVTVAWTEEPMEEKRIPIVEWGAHEVVLWGGDDGDRRVVVTFPLSLKTSALSKRVASRFLGKSWGSELPP